ncbi:hypothetical protein NFI96_024899 [Prochilodus magdalenae]|nr:hypothetical protein NFI96_024899 [Prochilodus magdalenae]
MVLKALEKSKKVILTVLPGFSRSAIVQRKADFEFLNPDPLFGNTDELPFIWAVRPRKRGRRASVLVRLRQRANSLDNNISELMARISFQRETRDCCILCPGETRSVDHISAALPDELNTFYARFEVNHTILPEKAPATADSAPHSVSVADVCKTFKRVNIHKASGPDGIPGRILKTARITTLNDWRPVALTSIISKCFEKLVRDFICFSLPGTLDPMQFAYRPNRCTDDAIALTLHTALSHLDKKNTYVRMLFVDYSSAFNTIVPSRLDIKLRDLGLNSSLCSWILNFLTDRRQVVKLAGITSSSLTLSTGAPQGCVLSPLLYSLYTHDCTARHSSNVIIKFADDTRVVGLISNKNEEAYREEVSFLTHWCRENNLSLNGNKTKVLIVDFRKKERVHTPITINGAAVERVSSFKFLGGTHMD